GLAGQITESLTAKPRRRPGTPANPYTRGSLDRLRQVGCNQQNDNHRENAMGSQLRLAAAIVAPLVFVAPGFAEEAPKRGGALTYMIPADAPPSFDGHREATFATVHATAPFYSVLIRINPENPASTTEFVCHLCTELA